MEEIGALSLNPDTAQAGMFTGDFKINGKTITRKFLEEHEVEVTLKATPTPQGDVDLFNVSFYQVIIDGIPVYQFK